MKSAMSKIWIPTVLIGMAALQSYGIDAGRAAAASGKGSFRDSLLSAASSYSDSGVSAAPDSLRGSLSVAGSGAASGASSVDGFLFGDSISGEGDIPADSISGRDGIPADSIFFSDCVAADSLQIPDSLEIPDSLAEEDSLAAPQLSARDTIVAPDSLRDIDPLKYRYFVELKDSLTRSQTRDSLRALGDSLELHRLDSLIFKDSSETAYRDSIAWFNSLSRRERKKYLAELELPALMARADSILNAKDSIRAYKDSVIAATPRILETYAVPDSMQYKRLIMWTHDRYFNNIRLQEQDTSYNYHFNDYPFMKTDVNATYLGVSGSPVETYNFFRRSEEENAVFYTPYMSYNYSPETLPMFNTKTPYTELAYWGTLFANDEKEETNIKVLTTQNILPELNVTLEYHRFGSNGMLQNEATDNRTFVAATNYMGKRYLMHAGYIYNRIERNENGGITENTWIRDTTVDAREIAVHLTNAANKTKKNTIFLDQSYRIPFDFIYNLGKGKRKARKAEEARRDSIMTSGDSTAIAALLKEEEMKAAEQADKPDSIDNRITTAFIGHSSEYSVFTKFYTDEIGLTDEAGRNFYNNRFYLNPTSSADSMRVMKFENRIYMRLQPWASDGIVSKLDVGIGDKLLNYYDVASTNGYLSRGGNIVRNSLYLYAGAQGQYQKYLNWDATGRYTFLGAEINDFAVDANIALNFYPFRRDRNSPLSVRGHFETSLREPDYYQEHFHSNHHWWDNDFGKISVTKAEAGVDIPRWKFSAGFGYSLLSNNIYYDNTGVARQNVTPMSVMSAYVTKNFRLWKFHLDNMALFQVSSNEDVMPLPMLALNLRYYLQFNVVKKVMQMQIGANATYTTRWFAPSYSPDSGVFHNQQDEQYGNCPYIDVFVNIQWKRACIFIKAVNLGMGWPNRTADYFSADGYIRPQRSIKFGIFWPFYVQSKKNSSVGGSATSGNGAGSSGRRSGGNLY